LAVAFFHIGAIRDCVAIGLTKRLPRSRSRSDGDDRLSSHSITVFGCRASAERHGHESWICPDVIAVYPPDRHHLT
jgi:hypothetical protein